MTIFLVYGCKISKKHLWKETFWQKNVFGKMFFGVFSVFVKTFLAFFDGFWWGGAF